MSKTFIRAAVLAVLAGSLSVATATPAGAYPTPPADGRRCSFNSITDPTLEGDAQTGQINGGPTVATAPGWTISMRCTIQVGAANAAHNGTDSCVAASTPTLQATVVPPTLCTYDSPDGFPVYLCTQVTVNGVDWYWDSTAPNAPFPNGAWTLSSSAPCDESTSVEILPGPLCTVTLNLYAALNNGPLDGEPAGTYTDGDFVSLGGGAVLIGPDGDMYTAGIWFPDCRPFDNPPTDPNRVIFPDQHICPLGPDGNYGLFIIYQGDLYFDENLNGIPEPNELVWDCPPYQP